MPLASLTPRAWVEGADVVPKPRLRGWIHLVAAPLSLAASVVLICLAQGPQRKGAAAVYLATSVVLFGVSALYHRFYWAPRPQRLLQRFDHANIFLLIAGTYTPIAVGTLGRRDSTLLLAIVWSGALVGIALYVFWPTAPRWLSTLVYVVLGWTAVYYLSPMWHSDNGPAIVWLILAGGILYTAGAVVYAAKKPDPWPRWFGFHEIFHSCTVLAWACHCVAAYLAIL